MGNSLTIDQQVFNLEELLDHDIQRLRKMKIKGSPPEIINFNLKVTFVVEDSAIIFEMFLRSNEAILVF